MLFSTLSFLEVAPMSGIFAIVIGIVFLVSLSIGILSKSKGIILVVITFWILVIGSFSIYILNPDVRRYVDTYVQPIEFHMVYDSDVPGLPLPPHTALSYRSSHEIAQYFSRLGVDEVILFYKQYSGIEIISRYYDQGVMMRLDYQGFEYVVLVTARERESSSFLLIEAREPR